MPSRRRGPHPGSDRFKILTFLRETPGFTYGSTEIADALELNPKSVAADASALAGRGLIQSDRRKPARYWVPEKGGR